MSDPSLMRNAAKRVVGHARERLVWPALHPNTFGVYAAILDDDPRAIEVPKLLLVETTYGGSLLRQERRIGPIGGGAERKRDEVKRWPAAAARRVGIHRDDPIPAPAESDCLEHRDAEITDETGQGIDPSMVTWIGDRTVSGTVNGNSDIGRLYIGHLGGAEVEFDTSQSRGEIASIDWYSEQRIREELTPNPKMLTHYVLDHALDSIRDIQLGS